jgi:hypothetical protein
VSIRTREKKNYNMYIQNERMKRKEEEIKKEEKKK